jgi:hypothetical protein
VGYNKPKGRKAIMETNKDFLSEKIELHEVKLEGIESLEDTLAPTFGIFCAGCTNNNMFGIWCG